VNYIREAEINAGVARESVYDVTLYVLATMLAVGFVCNWAIKPLAQRWFMRADDVAALQQHDISAEHATHGGTRVDATLILAWLAVGIPIAWGVWITLKTAFVLFG
jgi:hypothetical protein